MPRDPETLTRRFVYEASEPFRLKQPNGDLWTMGGDVPEGFVRVQRAGEDGPGSLVSIEDAAKGVTGDPTRHYE